MQIPEGDGARNGRMGLESANMVVGGTTDAGLESELFLLGPQARNVLLSQGITTVTFFLSVSTEEMATALAKGTEYTFYSARNKVLLWKKDVRQRLETRKELQLPVGLHLAFEVFDPEIRSFFTAMSIATPKDLLNCEDLAPVCVKWRRDNKMREMNRATTERNIYMWKASVTRQGTTYDTAPAGTTVVTSTAPSIISPTSAIVSGTKSPPSSVSPQKPFDGAQSTIRNALPVFTVDGRPMSWRLRRKMAKRTAPPIPIPAFAVAAANAQEQAVGDDSSSGPTDSGDLLVLATCKDHEDSSGGDKKKG